MLPIPSYLKTQSSEQAQPARFCNTDRLTRIFINVLLAAAAAGLIVSLCFTKQYGWTVPLHEVALGGVLMGGLNYNLPPSWRRLQQYFTVQLLYVLFYALWQVYFINPTEGWRANLLILGEVTYTATWGKELYDEAKRARLSIRKPYVPIEANVKAVSLKEECLQIDNLLTLGGDAALLTVGGGLWMGSLFFPSPWNKAAAIPALQMTGRGASGLVMRLAHILTSYYGKGDAIRSQKSTEEGPLLSTATRTYSLGTTIIQKCFAPFSIVCFILGVRVHELFLLASGAFSQLKAHQDAIHYKAVTRDRLRAENNPQHTGLLNTAFAAEMVVLGLISVGNPLYTLLRMRGHFSNPIYDVQAADMIGTFYFAYLAARLVQRAIRIHKENWAPFIGRNITYSPDLLGTTWLNLYVLSNILPYPYSVSALMAAWGAMMTSVGFSVAGISFLPPADPEDDTLVNASTSPLAHAVYLLTMYSQFTNFKG